MPTSPGEAHGTLRQFVRYGVVGVLGTVLHFGITILLVDGAGVDPVPASALGFLVAFAVQYVLNRAWVFESGVGAWRGLARYAAVCALGLLLSVALMYTATVVLGLRYLWGLVAIVAVVPLTNFTLNRLWTFEPERRAGTR